MRLFFCFGVVLCYNYGVNYILCICTEVIVIKKINIKNKKSRQFFADGSFFY